MRTRRARVPSALGVLVLALAAVSPASAATSGTRGPSTIERRGVLAAFSANDGSVSRVRAIYVSRADGRLAVACVRSPDAGAQAYVFRRSGRAWRYATSGSPGRSGSASERALERACR